MGSFIGFLFLLACAAAYLRLGRFGRRSEDAVHFFVCNPHAPGHLLGFPKCAKPKRAAARSQPDAGERREFDGAGLSGHFTIHQDGGASMLLTRTRTV